MHRFTQRRIKHHKNYVVFNSEISAPLLVMRKIYMIRSKHSHTHARTHARTHTHTCLTALCPGQPGWAGTRKVKPIWILLKQEIVRGSGISWAICKSAPRSRQITMPAPHHLVFLQAGCPSCRPTNSVKALKAVDQNTDRNIVNRRKIKTILILLCFISFSSV